MKNNEKWFFISFQIQIYFCTRCSLSTWLARTAFSSWVKDSRESKITEEPAGCGAVPSGKQPSPMAWGGTGEYSAQAPWGRTDFHTKDPMVLLNTRVRVLQHLHLSLPLLSVVSPAELNTLYTVQCITVPLQCGISFPALHPWPSLHCASLVPVESPQNKAEEQSNATATTFSTKSAGWSWRGWGHQAAIVSSDFCNYFRTNIQHEKPVLLP